MTASDKSHIARRHMITLRATEDEKRGIKARANAYGLSIGAYLREVALDKPLPKQKRVPTEDGQKLALALASLGIIMTELRRIEGSAPGENTPFDTIKTELYFLRDQCFTAAGRQP